MMQREIYSISGFHSSDKTLGETPKRQDRPRHRALVLILLATGLLGLHASRLVELQLVQGKQHRERAE
ncbi:Peptidoglycan D,D-transpeptidase MrdA, partial [uncultured Microcoleus sp.]